MSSAKTVEADWEIEIGGDAPVIDACWSGLVDLRLEPHRVQELPEVVLVPGLAAVLVRLNAPDSSVWTSKCDSWPLADPDPYELDSPPHLALHAVACYIDLLPVSDLAWPAPESAAGFCRDLCMRLRSVPLRSSRIDLIIRRAFILPDHPALGITAYLAACGPAPNQASAQLELVLAAFADVLFAAQTQPFRDPVI